MLVAVLILTSLLAIASFEPARIQISSDRVYGQVTGSITVVPLASPIKSVTAWYLSNTAGPTGGGGTSRDYMYESTGGGGSLSVSGSASSVWFYSNNTYNAGTISAQTWTYNVAITSDTYTTSSWRVCIGYVLTTSLTTFNALTGNSGCTGGTRHSFAVSGGAQNLAASDTAVSGSPASTYYIVLFILTPAQSGTHSATIDAVTSTLGIGGSLSISSRTISSTNCGTSCGSGNNLTGSPPAINVNTEYWFSTIVGQSDTLNHIDNLAIYLFKTFNATKGTFNEQRSYGFRWVRYNWAGAPTCTTTTGCWQELTGVNTWSATLTYLISADSTHSTPVATSGTWTFGAKLSTIAQYTGAGGPAHWNYEVDIQNIPTTSVSRTGQFDVNLFVSFTIPGAMNWGTLNPNLSNQSVAGNPYTSSYSGNAIFAMSVSGLGLNGSDTANIYNQYGDRFPLSNIVLCQTSPIGSCTGTNALKLSQTSHSLYTNLAVTKSSVNENLNWYLTTPNPFAPGTYSFQYTIDYLPSYPT